MVEILIVWADINPVSYAQTIQSERYGFQYEKISKDGGNDVAFGHAVRHDAVCSGVSSGQYRPYG